MRRRLGVCSRIRQELLEVGVIQRARRFCERKIKSEVMRAAQAPVGVSGLEFTRWVFGEVFAQALTATLPRRRG